MRGNASIHDVGRGSVGPVQLQCGEDNGNTEQVYGRGGEARTTQVLGTSYRALSAGTVGSWEVVYTRRTTLESL